MKNSLIAFLALCGMAGCVKPPSYPIEPHIEFKSVSSSLIKHGYVDTITFSFTDGDGDIGVFPLPGDTCDLINALKQGDSSCLNMSGFNIYLIDDRDTSINAFATAYVIPKGKYKALSGDIQVLVGMYSKTCFAPPQQGCPKDSVTYAIIFRDLAGHRSNTIHTTPIVIDGE
ncbi:MAG: hypothetical protein U0V74_13870 [Chitinophagales bacterium]